LALGTPGQGTQVTTTLPYLAPTSKGSCRPAGLVIAEITLSPRIFCRQVTIVVVQ
jgi:hypothetical protein